MRETRLIVRQPHRPSEDTASVRAESIFRARAQLNRYPPRVCDTVCIEVLQQLLHGAHLLNGCARHLRVGGCHICAVEREDGFCSVHFPFTQWCGRTEDPLGSHCGGCKNLLPPSGEAPNPPLDWGSYQRTLFGCCTETSYVWTLDPGRCRVQRAERMSVC
jgi:hypothetical protein